MSLARSPSLPFFQSTSWAEVGALRTTRIAAMVSATAIEQLFIAATSLPTLKSAERNFPREPETLLPSPGPGRPFERGPLVGASELANAYGRRLKAVERGSVHLFRVDDDSELNQRLVSERGGRKPTRQLRKIAAKIRGDNHNEAGCGSSHGRVDRRLD